MGRRAARERVRCRKGPTKGRKNAWVWTRLKSACALHSSSLPSPHAARRHHPSLLTTGPPIVKPVSDVGRVCSSSTAPRSNAAGASYVKRQRCR